MPKNLTALKKKEKHFLKNIEKWIVTAFIVQHAYKKLNSI